MSRDALGFELVESETTQRDPLGFEVIGSGGRDALGFEIVTAAAPDEFGIGQEFRGVGRAVQRGVLAADQRVTALGLDRNLDNARTAAAEYNEAAAALADFDRQAATNPAFAAAGQNWRQRQLGKLTKLSAEVDRRLPQVQAAIPRIARREQQIQAIPPSPDMASLGTDFWRTLATNPVETIATVVAESLPQAVPGMVAGAVMGGPVGMAAGAGANSLGMEYAGAILDSARKRGVNIADPQQLSAFIQDESALADARGFALKRGLPVAVFDAASAGLAGRFLNPAIGQGRRAVGVATAKELGLQAGAGMAGETAGQLASEGRISSVPDIVLEGIAELGTAPGEVFGNLRNEVSSRVREQMGGGMPKDQGPIAQADNELPDYREPAPMVPDIQGGDLNAQERNQERRQTLLSNRQTSAGLGDAPAAEGFTPIDQAVRQSRLGRMDPQAAVAEAVPAEGWTPVTSFIRREQMRPRPVTPETSAPEPGPTPEQRKASQEFDRLLIEIGPEAGWVDNLDALAPQMQTAKQDATTITARLARGAELRKLRFRAAQAFGLDAAKMNLDVRERAQLLPALQAYVEKVIVPQRQADSLTAAIQPDAGKQPVNTGDLAVGDVLNIDGEPVRVEAVDPDTGEVTLLDGTRFGRTTIADGQTIYVENVEQVAASTDFAPVEPVDSEDAKARSGADQSAIRNPQSAILAAPESVADQRARQEREAAQAKTKADREKLAELQAKPLTGSVGDIGATDMFDASKNDLFSAPAPKAKEQKPQQFEPILSGRRLLSVTTRPDTSTWQVTVFTDETLETPAGHEGFKTLPEALSEIEYRGDENREVADLGKQSGNLIFEAAKQNPGAAQMKPTNFIYSSPLRPMTGVRVPDSVSALSFKSKSGGMAGVVEVSRPLSLSEMGRLDLAPINASATKAYWKAVADKVFPNHQAVVAGKDATPTDKAIAALESLKVDTAGKVFDAIQGIPVAVWNGALSAAQLALKAGAKVADAIAAALAHIRAKHKAKFDEAAVRAELENGLQQRQFAEQIDAAPDIAQPVKDATTNRFYTRKPNESTAAFAGRIITGVGGAQPAVAVFTDATNGLGGAERAMLGQLIVKQLSAAGQHEAAARFLDDTFLPYSTEAAQTLQAFAAFANLTPEGAMIYAKRQFNRAQRQPRERIQPTLDTAVDVLDDLNRQGIEATVKDGLVQAEAGDTVTDAVVADGRKPGSRLQRAILTESADRMRRAILLYRGTDSPRTILAKLTSRDGYWNALVKGQQNSLTSALMLALGLKPQQQLLTGSVSQLAADLGRVLRQQAEATLARQRTPVTPRTARQQLLTLLLNSERMAEVWAGVRATLEAEGKTDPNVLRVLGTTMDVWSKPLLAQVAREYLKTADVNLSELVRNHYIEATDGRPQATLAAKIVEWLGVDEAAAKPLAAAFDTVLREEAEKVRAGLRKRIDAVKRDPRWKRTLASGIADPENLPDTEVDAALMQAIREQRVQLGRLVREHFRTVDATGKSLADRVAAVSGVSPDRAKRLAAVVQARFAERVKAAKAAAIGRIEQVQPVPREVKQVWQRLVELSNLGALNRETAWNAVAERLKLPQWTADIAKETQRLAQRVAETPEGINRQKRVIELHNYLARATGVPVMDTVLAFWYANTLSGPTTQAVNLLANVQNLVANLAIEARHPRDFVAQLAAVGRGLQQGGREAAEVLRTGILTRPGNTKLAASRPLELLQLPGRLDYLLTPFRLVGRALAAGDSLFFHAGQESRAVLLARQLARSEGLSGPALQRRVAEALARSSRQRFRAVRQALREGLSGVDLARRVDDLTLQQRPEGINDNARDYALRLTFNQKPYGLLGAIAHGINWAGAQPFGLPLRLVVPFTNVVANVANESLNYVPPIGVARAAWGHWKGTLEGQPITDRNALGDQWAKATLGTVLLGMVWAAAEGGLEDEDPWFMVNGAGPREANKKNQLRATGWIPFSLKVGNRYVSFANSPVAMPLAAVGNYFDARRYRQLDEQDAWNRIAYAFTTMGKVILEQSFLDGIARIVGSLDRDNVNAGKELAQSIGRTAGNFVIPNAVRQIDRLFDPTVYDAATTEAALINSVPYARRLNRPALNVWGEPVRNELTKRFASTPTDDPLLAVLSRRGLWISAPSRTQTEHLNGQPMTPDEFYEFTRHRGQTLKRLASRPGIQKALQNLPEEQAQRLWSRLQTTATRQAKAKVRPVR